MRIVSLLPSATEIICALGLRDQLVGISHECDYPADLSLPVVTQSRLDPRATSREIDDEVRRVLRNGLSLYQVDIEKITELKPDLIVTQDQCQVCAVSLAEIEHAIQHRIGSGTQICSVHPRILSDLPKTFLQIGEAVGARPAADALATKFRQRFDRLSELKFPSKPKVLGVEWMDPPMVGGLWIPELIKKAGGEPLIVDKPTKFAQTDWNSLVQAKPDVLCLFPCGYPIDRTLSEINAPDSNVRLSAFRAATEGRCFIVDGSQYFNRPGPRLADSAEILAHLLHPTLAKAIPVPKDSFVIWRPPY